jgi:hypothetical protein
MLKVSSRRMFRRRGDEPISCFRLGRSAVFERIEANVYRSTLSCQFRVIVA